MPAPASSDRVAQLETDVAILRARVDDLEGALALIVQHFEREAVQKVVMLMPPDANDKGS